MNFRLILVAGAITVLSACGGLPVDWSASEPGASAAPPVAEPDTTVPSAPAEPGVSDDAVDQLLGEALQRREEGDLEGAISLAERALRIDPRSARVYYVLGILQFDKGEVASALQLARKARSLDNGGHYQDSIDILIAECELALEDSGGEAVW